MGTLALLVGVALIAALCGYAVGRANPRRARRVFIAGFLCGSVAGSVLRRRLFRRSFSGPRRRIRSRLAVR